MCLVKLRPKRKLNKGFARTADRMQKNKKGAKWTQVDLDTINVLNCFRRTQMFR